MTHKEVYQELERDKESISRWWSYKTESLCHRIKTAKRFPVSLTFEHTSPRRVKYLFIASFHEKRMRIYSVSMLALRQMADGLAVYSTLTTMAATSISHSVLLPHVFRRYAERVGVDKHGVELIKHFFLRNRGTANSRNQSVVGRSVRYKDMTHLSMCVNDGVVLGQQIGDVFEGHTFVTYDMCSGLQREEFEKTRQRILPDDWREWPRWVAESLLETYDREGGRI